jgi:hypothetical protein
VQFRQQEAPSVHDIGHDFVELVLADPYSWERRGEVEVGCWDDCDESGRTSQERAETVVWEDAGGQAENDLPFV